MDFREKLLERIGDINDFTRPRPLVTLEEFFEGNDDPGSIGYDLPDGPSPPEFYAFLSTLRGHAEIADVRIEVKDLEDSDGWPSTDTVWFVTSLTQAGLEGHFDERVRPDEWLRYPPRHPVEPLRIPPGMQGIAAWYD